MKKSFKDKIYKNFHSKTGIQAKIIEEGNFTYRILLDVVKKFVKPKMHILDIGCGAGTLSLFLANRGNRVRGIDYSNDAIIKCKKSAYLLNLKNAYFDKMDFPKNIPKGKYNLVMCLEVLEHIQEDDLALRKIHSLLHKDGILIISVPSKNAPVFRIGAANKFDKKVGHLRRYNSQELASLCKEADLKILEIWNTEGILRNILFLNSFANKLVRFIRGFIADWVTLIDNQFVKLFGESQIIIVAQKK